MPDDPPSSETEDAQALVGAVHQLLRRDQSHSQQDLMLTAVTHALAGHSLSTADLAARVETIWPLAGSEIQISAALDLGEKLNLISSSDALVGDTLWSLTERGADDISSHRQWAAGIKRNAAGELASRMHRELGEQPDSQQAEAYLGAVMLALTNTIRKSGRAYLGDIERLMNGGVAPRALDRKTVVDEIRSVTENHPLVSEFLEGQCLAAIDPLDPFGNELVSYITIGCVLHSYAAQTDRNRIVKSLGSQGGQRLFIDTPYLLKLISCQRVRRPVEEVISTAIRQGWDVQVFDHSLEELKEVTDRGIVDMSDSFAKARANGTKEDWYAGLVDDQVPGAYIEAMRDETYTSLNEFRLAPSELQRRLETLGVICRPAANTDSARVKKFATALECRVSRSRAVIQRDADTMAALERRRRRETQGKWPGCWVLTNDRRMAPAYLDVTKDKVSACLTLPQLSSLLTLFADDATIVDLAEASAAQWVDEAMWSIPARYPKEFALQLASDLSLNGTNPASDLRSAQLSLEDLLEEERPTPLSIASNISSARSQRVRQLADEQRRRADAARDRAEDERNIADKAALKAEAAKEQAERGRLEAQILERSSSERARDLEAELTWRNKQTRRIIVSFCLAVLPAAVVVVGVSQANLATILIGIATGLFLAVAAYKWCTDERSRLVLIVASAGSQLIGIAAAGFDLFDRLPPG